MRRQTYLKSKTYTEVLQVDVAVINVEVSAQYPGRSPLLPLVLPLPRGGGKAMEKSAEGIVGREAEGPNMTMNEIAIALSSEDGDADRRVEIPESVCGDSERNSRKPLIRSVNSPGISYMRLQRGRTKARAKARCHEPPSIRNRTSGGVGGRREQSRLLPDVHHSG